jgi:hypothetical protein
LLLLVYCTRVPADQQRCSRLPGRPCIHWATTSIENDAGNSDEESPPTVRELVPERRVRRGAWCSAVQHRRVLGREPNLRVDCDNPIRPFVGGNSHGVPRPKTVIIIRFLLLYLALIWHGGHLACFLVTYCHHSWFLSFCWIKPKPRHRRQGRLRK